MLFLWGQGKHVIFICFAIWDILHNSWNCLITYIFAFIFESFDGQVLKDTLTVSADALHGIFLICFHPCSLLNTIKGHFILNEHFIHILQLLMK